MAHLKGATSLFFCCTCFEAKKKTAADNVILLMAEILHHLGCMKPYKYWDKLPINWCRISAINSSLTESPKRPVPFFPLKKVFWFGYFDIKKTFLCGKFQGEKKREKKEGSLRLYAVCLVCVCVFSLFWANLKRGSFWDHSFSSAHWLLLEYTPKKRNSRRSQDMTCASYQVLPEPYKC